MEEETLVGKFIKRDNRFVCTVQVGENQLKAHVKSTGRMAELFLQGAKVVVRQSSNPNRKTAYDLVAVWREGQWFNVDSQVPNRVIYDGFEQGNILTEPILSIKREVTYSNARLDMKVRTEKETYFVEVKGVTLERDGLAWFPDAPTSRGVKHLKVLMEAVSQGYRGMMIFLVQFTDVDGFCVNRNQDPTFADALEKARRQGVEIRAFDCLVTPSTIEIKHEIPIIWEEERLNENNNL